jgi:hypothetical protein
LSDTLSHSLVPLCPDSRAFPVSELDSQVNARPILISIQSARSRRSETAVRLLPVRNLSGSRSDLTIFLETRFTFWNQLVAQVY